MADQINPQEVISAQHGVRLITSSKMGPFQSFVANEDTKINRIWNAADEDVTSRYGLSGNTIKSGIPITPDKEDRLFNLIDLSSGSVVAQLSGEANPSG